jgi:molybdopterin/thiamine biosynthesis adenylyltransferase
MDNLEKEIYARNIGVITPEEQIKLKNITVTVIGAGGVGGITLISLARMGFGSIQVIDGDEFEYSNINRQMLSAVSKVGKSKAECAKEAILDINPNIKVSIRKEMMTEYNIEEIITGSDIVVDATDNLVSRVIIHRTAQKLNIHSIWIAVTPPFRGGVITFSHNTPDYEVVLSHPSHGKELTEEVKKEISLIKDRRAKISVEHGALDDWADAYINKNAPWAVICPVANIVGICASFEAFKIALGRVGLKPVYAPNLLRIDMSKTIMIEETVSKTGTWDNAEL